MISQALTIARKDIKTEFRTREMINPMIIFSLVSIISFKFASMFYESEALSEPLDVGPWVSPILWVTFSCLGMFALLSSFSKEKNSGSLDGLLLCPVDRSAIYFGKVISNFLLILLVNILSLILFAAVFSFDYQGNFIPLFGVIVFGTFCLVIVGTLVSGISINSNCRKILLPIILVPVILYTVLWPSIIATSKALEGSIIEAISELRVMGMFALIYIAIVYMLFNYVVEE